MESFLKKINGWLNSPRAFYLISFAGLSIRLIFLALVWDKPFSSDALSYHNTALNLCAVSDAYWPPGLPYFLAFSHLFLGKSQIASRVSMLFVYLALNCGLYLLTQKLSGRKAANLAVFIFSLYPEFIYLSIFPLTQMPTATLLLLLGYSSILAYKKYSPALSCLIGLISGSLILIRPSNLLLALYIPLHLYRKTLQTIPVILTLVLTFGIISPWIIKASHAAGHFVLINSANSMNFFFGNNQYTPLYKTWWQGSHSSKEDGVPEGFINMHKDILNQPLSIRDKLYFKLALTHILERPDLFLLRTLNRIRIYFAFDTFSASDLMIDYNLRYTGMAFLLVNTFFYISIMMMALLFLFSYKTLPIESRVVKNILAIIIIYTIPYIISFSHPTYHFPVLPLFGTFASAYLGNLMRAPAAQDVHPFFLLKKYRGYLMAAVGIFFYIQLEWVFVMSNRLVLTIAK